MTYVRKDSEILGIAFPSFQTLLMEFITNAVVKAIDFWHFIYQSIN